MYRNPSPPSPDEPPPRELVYVATDRTGRDKPALAQLQMFALPGIFGALCATMIGPTSGLVGIAVAAIALVLWRRGESGRRIILRVESGELCILSPGARVARLRLPLDQVLDIALDTKTIRRVEDGASAIPALRFIDSRVGPEVDTTRVVIVTSEHDEPLTKEYLPHMDTTEAFGKIRVFLRKHGWVPEAEREDQTISD